MLRTAHLSGTHGLLAAAMAMLATSPSAGPVVVRTRAFEDFAPTLRMPVFDAEPLRKGKWPRRAEQSARLKAKRRGH